VRKEFRKRNLCHPGAFGWHGAGTPVSGSVLIQLAMHIMAIAIVPVAVSVHTIVSWISQWTPSGADVALDHLWPILRR